MANFTAEERNPSPSAGAKPGDKIPEADPDSLD